MRNSNWAVALLAALLVWHGCREADEGLAPPARPAMELNLHNHLGEQRLGERQYAPAISAFEEALARAEDSVRAYTGISRAYLALGEAGLAEELLQQAARLDTSRAEVWYVFAELHLDQYLKTHQGPFLEEAVRQARRAVQLAPGEKAYFYGLGNLHTHRGDLDSAEAAYRQALALDPGLKPAYARLGSLYKYQGRLAEAERMYQRQLELDPEDVQALCEFAILCRSDGRSAEARALLEKAVRLDTSSAAAWLNLGQLYLAEGRVQEGERALARFQALGSEDTANLLAEAEARPQDAKAQVRLARAYVRDRNYAGAEQFYRRALQLDSGLSEARAGLEELHRLQGEEKQALEQVRVKKLRGKR